MSKSKPNVFLICTGVGHINRGYETFTIECFDELKSSPDFDLFLLKGAGKSARHELTIPCIRRNTKAALFLSKITGHEKYWVEQFTFLIGMLPSLIRRKPSVIYYSDFVLGTFLFHLRRFLKFKYKLLFSNGSPNGPPYKTEDHVQQLLAIYEKEGIDGGTPPEKQTLLPYGFKIDIDDRRKAIKEKDALKKTLGLDPDKKIVLSVGAINKYHKRMDYVVNEVAKLPDDYFLVILGQYEQQTEEIKNLAANKLPGRHIIANVSPAEVKKYYVVSDYFVLGSLVEGFGRVIIEALSYGMPCVVNNYVNAVEVLGEYGDYVDMKTEGALSAALLVHQDKFSKEQRIEASYNIYSWDKLKEGYSDMIKKLIW
ncbi:glycosyltransferase family 4 protein [Mucilaginibacter sp. AW1-3]